MPHYEPIPIPLKERIREFRMRLLPLLGVAAAVAGVVHLWSSAVSPAVLTGVVEPVSARVVSTATGSLVELSVERFQWVKQGTVLGMVRPEDSRAELEFMRNQLALQQTGLDPLAEARRAAVDYQKLRLSWLQQKVDLVSARINLQFAASDLERAEKLLETNAITGRVFESRLKARDGFSAEVQERENVVTELGRELETLKTPEVPPAQEGNDPLADLLRVQRSRMLAIEKNLGLSSLVAPMDGMVVELTRLRGENVLAGETILRIEAGHSDKIVGYLKQPLPVEPKVGMSVEVRTRTPLRQRGEGQVRNVGVGFESVMPRAPRVGMAWMPAAGGTPEAGLELGLPIEVSLPAGMRVRPGEVVDLVLR